MTLASGTRLGPYEIRSPLGVGGMGEVYRAKDTTLNRDVALKVLPASLAGDPDRLARFKREAQVLASLNHPNIGHIYGFQDAGPTQALVLEIVEGPTLADRIAVGPLPPDEVVAIARQVADAMESAHEQGIIHRDLKPANIKIRDDGTVKVLDFGLAKALEPAGAASSAIMNSPTLSAHATDLGVILGTAAYMAPEQAKGKTVDKRADIWAFGVVLFEMLTGRTLFAGETVAETLARVIEREPDLSTLPAAIPRHLRTIVARCLVRDPRERMRDIGEARLALAKSPTDELPLDATRPRRRSWNATLAWCGAVAAAALIAAALVWQIRAPAPAPLRRFTIATPHDATPLSASISPDGRLVALIADDKVWLQKLDEFTPTEVPGSGGAHAVFWSPDSSQLGFQARGQLWRVAMAGGSPVTLGRVPEFTGATGGAAWVEDHRIVFTTGGTGLLVMPATGGQAEPLFELDPRIERDVHNASPLPSHRGVLFVPHPVVDQGGDTIDVYVLPAGPRKTLLRSRASIGRAVYSPTGHLLFEQRNGVWAVRFSLETLSTTGDPFLVADDAREPTAADGTIVLLPGGGRSPDRRLTWIDATGKPTRPPIQGSAGAFMPRISPDGRLVAAARGNQEETDIWVFDAARGTERRLTFESGIDTMPSWTPDGRFIVYECAGRACARRADGGGVRIELLDGQAIGPLVSPDGRFLVFARDTEPGNPDYWLVELGTRGVEAPITATPRPFLKAPRQQRQMDISPDSRFAAYNSYETGPSTGYVTKFPSGEGKWEMPIGIDRYPRWSAKGDRLYFADSLNRIVEFEVDLETTFESGPPIVRVAGNVLGRAGFDRSPDGKELLVLSSSTAPSRLASLLIVQNWKADADGR